MEMDFDQLGIVQFTAELGCATDINPQKSGQQVYKVFMKGQGMVFG